MESPESDDLLEESLLLDSDLDPLSEAVFLFLP